MVATSGMCINKLKGSSGNETIDLFTYRTFVISNSNSKIRGVCTEYFFG